jgi:hypothetical protein
VPGGPWMAKMLSLSSANGETLLGLRGRSSDSLGIRVPGSELSERQEGGAGRALMGGRGRLSRSNCSPGWCLGLGMHLFRQAVREAELLGNAARKQQVYVKKSTRRQSKSVAIQGRKRACLSFLELPFCTKAVRRMWSRGRSSRRDPYRSTAAAVILENPSIYHGLMVSSRKRIKRSSLRTPVWTQDSLLIRGLGYKDGRARAQFVPGAFLLTTPRIDFPPSLHPMFWHAFWNSVPASLVEHRWDVEKPARMSSRRKKRSWWWLTKVVKKMPDEDKVGLISRDDRRCQAWYRKYRKGAPLKMALKKGKRFFIPEHKPLEVGKVLRRCCRQPVRRERWMKRKRKA